jgi:hypothetical protein
MKTLIRSVNRSPLRCGFLTLAIALAWFALSPSIKAQCPSDCSNDSNTSVGNNALPATTGFNNTAVGSGALAADTTGSFNVAIGGGALQSNTTGQQNMAIGAEALSDSNGNFNMAIGFRALFLNTGSRNSAVGAAALRNNTTAEDNTAIGSTAMRENTTGELNTAIGSAAMLGNTTGQSNTAVGADAMTDSTTTNDNTAVGTGALSSATGDENTAVGSSALSIDAAANNTAVGFSAMADASGSGVTFNTAVGWNALVSTTANANVAVGDLALQNDTSGFFNTAIGAATGISQTTGNNNIYIGQGSFGVAGESHTCYIQEIFGQLSSGGAFVFVNSAGKLGTTTSSKRFKEDIKAMDKASEALFALKPVTFRYKKEIEPKAIPQWGLVAEDVEKVNPDLVIRDAEGKVNTVRYDQVYNMMLNEFLKEHKKVQELEATVAQQQKGMEALIAQVREQAAQIQKVSAQMKMNKPAPQVVANSE